MTKRAVWPKSIVNLPFSIPWSKGVRFDGLDWICGMGGGPNAPPDDFAPTLHAQTREVLLGIEEISRELGTERHDIIHMVMFYEQQGDEDEDAYRKLVYSLLPQGDRVVLTFIPCTHFAPHTMKLEVDTWLHAGQGDPPRFATLADGRVGAVRTGSLIQIGSVTGRGGSLAEQTDSVFRQLSGLLEQLGATLGDMTRLDTSFLAHGSDADVHARWLEGAQLRARKFAGRGPAIADIPVKSLWPRGAQLACSGWAIAGEPRRDVDRATESKLPGGLEFPQGVRCGRYLFLSGQRPLDAAGRLVGAGDIRAQARAAMQNAAELLASEGFGFLDVLRLNAHYRGPSGMDELLKNIEVRRSFWPEGHALSPTVATGVPRHALAWPGQLFEAVIIAAR